MIQLTDSTAFYLSKEDTLICAELQENELNGIILANL